MGLAFPEPTFCRMCIHLWLIRSHQDSCSISVTDLQGLYRIWFSWHCPLTQAVVFPGCHSTLVVCRLSFTRSVGLFLRPSERDFGKSLATQWLPGLCPEAYGEKEEPLGDEAMKGFVPSLAVIVRRRVWQIDCKVHVVWLWVLIIPPLFSVGFSLWNMWLWPKTHVVLPLDWFLLMGGTLWLWSHNNWVIFGLFSRCFWSKGCICLLCSIIV